MAEAIIAEARQIGYVVVPKLEAATHLYESPGLTRRDAYYDTPVAETIFIERTL